MRSRRGLPGRLAVDSCAGEFEARTPYYYLSHETGDGEETATGAIVLLGSGTNRIGQGIEFDYCCVRAAQAFRRLGHEVVLVNSNPETVSTDYDTCDRLYLEPVTLEHVLDVVELERPLGVVLSLGGQTPLGLAAGLAEAGVPLLGDPLDAIDTAEDRGRFGALLAELGLRAPAWGHVNTTAEARELAELLGYPVLVRPSYVLGGRGMRVARTPAELELSAPALVDRFLEGALELDVDILCDGEDAWVAAIIEHVERAGVHSGDSACVLPAPSVGSALEAEIRTLATTLARGLGARGLLNLQLALHEGELLRARGEPARLADDPLRREGDRSSARRSCVPFAPRRLARRARAAGAGRPGPRVGEGSDLPVGALRGRCRQGRRDALDRRGDDERPDGRGGLSPRVAGGGTGTAARRDRRAADARQRHVGATRFRAA